MASRSARRLSVVVLAWLVAAPVALAAQAPARTSPLGLSFSDAVRLASGQAPAVSLATLRADEADARVRQVRAALLPSLSLGGSWLNRTFNSKSLGIDFSIPTQTGPQSLPELIGPFHLVDARVSASQALFDWSSVARVRAARAQADGSRAERGVSVEGTALTAALAYLRGVRAQAVVAARQADSTVAAELVGLAEAQKAAGVSAAIDVTRARTQLVTAEGLLLVARNQLDRARIDLTRALGIDPATPLAFTDTLTAALGAADVPAARDSVVAAGLANRPDLRAELARAGAARQTGAAIRAERLPRLEVGADYGVNGRTVPGAIATRDLTLQVSVPILDGFRREGRLAEQDAVVRESQVRERDLRQQIAADVDGALLDLHSAQAQQVVAAERLRLAAQELSQSRERFKAGVAGNIEVIDAQSNLIRARDTDIDARFAAASARVSLARAAGVARTLH
ncbi:MAG TPA: TolC family protein [Gemmatimonadales bacterium]|nr:TolC family protein [Gemmatimonadales bacterium]